MAEPITANDRHGYGCTCTTCWPPRPAPACTFPGCVEHECQLCGRVRTHDAAVAEGPCDCGPEHWEALAGDPELLTPGERVADGESCGIVWYLTAVCARHLPEMASRVSQAIGW